jgi:hypothetical protein
MVNVIMLTDAYGLQAGQYSQFTPEEYARLKSAGVCQEIETVKAAPKQAAKETTKKK